METTIKSAVIKSMEKAGATFVAESSCWNYHNNACGKNSKLAKDIANLPKLDEGFAYLVVVGTKGRSAHSKTQLLIFKAPSNVDIGMADTSYRNFWFV